MPSPPAGPRDELAVRGADAATYLQGQLSADVEALAVGADSLALLLEPTGKLCAILRVRRSADDEFAIDVDPGAGEVVLARLRRFLLRTAATVELRATSDAGAPRDEVARLREGWPAFGSEYGGGHSGDVIPAELGDWLIEEAVSFTKGCYVGQELTARIDSRGGNVPRHLRAFELPAGTTASPGYQVVAAAVDTGEQGEGEPAGIVTSTAADPATGATLVMGLVARKVPDDAVLGVRVR